MSVMAIDSATLSFSGHETFILRSNWLKKAYDILQEQPDLFFLEDAFVRLGVGKNMAQSIRFWGRACHVFERLEDSAGHRATRLGVALLDDHGWDPFLVTPASGWLLHWQIVARPQAAFTWYYTFNLLRGSELTPAALETQLALFVAQHGGKSPSKATLTRDINCMLRCYVRPDAIDTAAAAEDALHCPLHQLGLIQALPGQSAYHLASDAHASLPDALVAYAAFEQARALGRTSLAFNELAYGERSPGRLFRLDEDALLSRLLHMEALTGGTAAYSETGGIRQLAWRTLDARIAWDLLDAAFAEERHHV